jgi:ABC-type multidrug transport system ATPase subunit
LTETAPAPSSSVTNLIKQFGRFAALRGVTAEFSGGKLYAILGDNGAGKTTLLRTLAGLNQPSSGQVSILGASKFHDICGRSVTWRILRCSMTR